MATHQPGRRIVVGVDGSECALQAVRWAAAEALRRRLPLRLVSAYIWPSGRLVGDPRVAIEYRRILRDAADEQLAAAARTAATVAPALEVEQMPVDGLAEQVLEAESVDAALVVLGDRGLGGFTGLLIGSVSVALAAHAGCPVVVIRGPEPDTAVPRTGGRRCRRNACGRGRRRVRLRGRRAALRSVAVHTWQDQLIDPRMATLLDFGAITAADREVLAEPLAGWSEKYPTCRCDGSSSATGPPTPWCRSRAPRSSWSSGSRGRGGLTGMLLGSVSQAVPHHAHCRSPSSGHRWPQPLAGVLIDPSACEPLQGDGERPQRRFGDPGLR
jgi:nucleotide-binding universal stress UspA family protein